MVSVYDLVNSFTAFVGSIDNLIPLSLIILGISTAAYYFGKLKIASDPIMMDSKFQIYLNGIFFIMHFLGGGTIFAYILYRLLGQFNLQNMNFEFGILVLTIPLLVLLFINEQAKKEGIRKSLRERSRIVAIFISLSALQIVLMSIVKFPQTNLLRYSIFVIVGLIFYTLLAYTYGQIMGDRPLVDLILENGKKIERVRLIEVEGAYMKTIDVNSMPIIVPIEKVSYIKIINWNPEERM